jgi:hypothetical protein
VTWGGEAGRGGEGGRVRQRRLGGREEGEEGREGGNRDLGEGDVGREGGISQGVGSERRVPISRESACREGGREGGREDVKRDACIGSKSSPLQAR